MSFTDIDASSTISCFKCIEHHGGMHLLFFSRVSIVSGAGTTVWVDVKVIEQL